MPQIRGRHSAGATVQAARRCRSRVPDRVRSDGHTKCRPARYLLSPISLQRLGSLYPVITLIPTMWLEMYRAVFLVHVLLKDIFVAVESRRGRGRTRVVLVCTKVRLLVVRTRADRALIGATCVLANSPPPPFAGQSAGGTLS